MWNNFTFICGKNALLYRAKIEMIVPFKLRCKMTTAEDWLRVFWDCEERKWKREKLRKSCGQNEQQYMEKQSTTKKKRNTERERQSKRRLRHLQRIFILHVVAVAQQTSTKMTMTKITTAYTHTKKLKWNKREKKSSPKKNRQHRAIVMWLTWINTYQI